MAKYDWKQLEKEFILGDYKSVSAFLREKGMSQSGSTKNKTKGWKNKKAQKEIEKSTKIIEKTIEKESEKEAQQIVDLKSIANDLALNIIKANTELNLHLATEITKTKEIEYNYKTKKPKKEVIEEKQRVHSYTDIIDRRGLKDLATALKDINEVLNNKADKRNEDVLSRLDKLLEEQSRA